MFILYVVSYSQFENFKASKTLTSHIRFFSNGKPVKNCNTDVALEYVASAASLAPVLCEFQIELRKWGRELLIKKVSKTFEQKESFKHDS